MNILITGGAGFIGSHLAKALLSDGHGVAVLDDLSTGAIANIQHLNDQKLFTFINGSVLDSRLTEKLVAENDVVCHLAAAVGVKYVMDRPISSMHVNISGTENVLSAAAKRRRRVFIASTSEVYGKGNGAPFREEDEMLIGPTSCLRWSYACSKALDEFMAFAYRREFQVPIVIGRFFNTCGPRQTGKYGMVIPRLVRSALRGEPLQVYGDGSQTRCFAYVGDAVRAVIALLESPEAEGQAFNIGGTDGIRILDLAKKIIELTRSSSCIEFVPYSEAYGPGFEDIRWRVPDTAKIRRFTGWIPQVGLDELLGRVIEYEKTESHRLNSDSPGRLRATT